MLNNNRIGYLHFWCQKVLPLVYDNSLSHLEVLFKVKEKLNEVIKFTNQIPEYIDKKFMEEFDEEHLKELISEVFRTIEDAISANNEGTNTHFSTNYPVTGTLVWHDNKLYKTKHPIDAGDTVLPDSNIELVNFGDMFNEFLIEVKTRFTDNDDGDRETASTDRPVHDLVWLNNELYEVIKPIAEGNAYIYSGANKNVESTNLDKIYDYLLDLISSEINAREEADNNLSEAITTAVNDEATARENADDRLDTKIDNEITNREEAITGNYNTLHSEIDSATSSLYGEITDEATARSEADIRLENMFNVNSERVNVRAFGAVGDAKYYNKTDNRYYKDSSFTQTPTNDYTAIQAAITYATSHGIKNIFFPKGSYYCGAGTFNIGEDSVSFIGETGTELISSGLTSGAFITVACGSQYADVSTVLENITILGSYFKNDWTQNAVIGINFGTDGWTQGRSINNIGIALFNVGIHYTAATEFHMNDSKIILCDTGVVFGGSGAYNPMPAWFNNVTIELNGRGIFASKGGYSTLFLTNCGLSGGSQLYQGFASIKMTNCRMEFALNDCCDKFRNPVPPIDIVGESGGDSISGVSFTNCQILTTGDGVNVAKLMFWTGDVYTRSRDIDYLIDMRNGYFDGSCPITFVNCEVNSGSKGYKMLVQQNMNDYRVGCTNMKVNLTADRMIALGNNIMSAKELVYYDTSHLSVNGDTYTSTGASFNLDVPPQATAMSIHIEPTSGSIATSLVSKAKDGTYTQNSASRNIPSGGDWTTQTLAMKLRQNVETVTVSIGAGSFSAKDGNFWIEFVY